MILKQSTESLQLPIDFHSSPPPLLLTPYNHRQLRTAVDSITANEKLSKSVRLLFQKTAKSLDSLAFDKTEDTLRLKGQARKLSELTVKSRKKVAINAQTAFADIVVIKAAQDKARAEEKRAKAYEKRYGTKEAREAAEKAQYVGFEACCTVFVLDRSIV